MGTKYSIAGKGKQREQIISEEAAQAQVVDILAYYDIDIDQIGQANKAAGAALERAADAVRDWVRTGQLEVTRDPKTATLLVKHTLEDGTEVMYHEVSARAKMAMDSVEGQRSQVYAFMGSLSKLGAGAIEKFRPADLSIVEVLGTLFSNA